MQMEMLQIMDMENKSSNKSKEIHLTERDFAIIEFLNEMKFGSASDVFEKFFKITTDQEIAKNDLWTKKRLSQLESLEVLKRTKAFHENTVYYQATKKGVTALRNMYPERSFSNYFSGFDLNTFHHDKTVLRARLYLELSQYAFGWQSDRNLKQQTAVNEAGLKSYVPDGVFLSADGCKVALEIEIAQKARKCYQEKIAKFLDHIEGKTAQTKIFDVVHFVCDRERVFEILKEETQFYSSYFKVTRTSDFFNGDYHAPQENKSQEGL